MVKKNFTLIELLVVIAIIAILAAILLPALQSARTRAQASSCVSNLKQMGTIAVSYMDDHRGFWPAGNPYIESKNSDGLYTINYVSNLYKGKYIGRGAVDNTGEDFARCGAVPISKLSTVLFPQVYGTQYVHNGERPWYAVNALGYFPGQADWNRGAKKSAQVNSDATVTPIGPSQRMLLGDNTCVNIQDNVAQSAYFYAYSGNNKTYLGAPYLVHGGRINMLTVASNVVSADEGSFCSEYYFPWFGGTPKASSILATDYVMDGVQLKNPYAQ